MYQRALEINVRLARPEGMANDYGNIGTLLLDRGDLAAAETMFLKSLDIDEKIGRPEGIANTYANLGKINEKRG